MIKTTLFTLLLCLLFVINGNSQKLKLRLDIGNSINFTSYRSKLFQEYYQGPISTSEYTYRKLPTGSLFDIPLQFGISLEYDDHKKNHFAFGIMLSDVISASDRVIFNFAYQDDLGYYVVTPWSDGSESESLVGKFGFEYARDLNKGRFRFSPLIGLSYAWNYGVSPFDTIGKGYTSIGPDNLYNSSEILIERINTITGYTGTMMASIGFNLRVYSKKRELFALKLFYQQGFRAIEMNQVIVTRGNKKFIYNVSYSYGSALYLKMSIPIPIYNYDKKNKMKMDRQI